MLIVSSFDRKIQFWNNSIVRRNKREMKYECTTAMDEALLKNTMK